MREPIDRSPNGATRRGGYRPVGAPIIQPERQFPRAYALGYYLPPHWGGKRSLPTLTLVPQTQGVDRMFRTLTAACLAAVLAVPAFAEDKGDK